MEGVREVGREGGRGGRDREGEREGETCREMKERCKGDVGNDVSTLRRRHNGCST